MKKTIYILCLLTTARTDARPLQLEDILITAPRWPARGGVRRSGLDPLGRTLFELPASAAVADAQDLERLEARERRDAAAIDPAAAENYAPIGYYSSLSVRGFTLDDAGGYLRNGLRIVNEAAMPLENKAAVEIRKGVAGFETGAASPGGAVDHRTKTAPKSALRYARAAGNGTGGRLLHADVGGRFGPGGAFGYRVNAAHEYLRPYVVKALGDRAFVSAYLEALLSAGWRLWFDGDRHRKTQLSVPGYQPLGPGGLPENVDPAKMLNDQPWSAPVRFETVNLGGGAEWSGESGAFARVSVNHNANRTDDNAAFPYGCTQSGFQPTFCPDGSYDLYDYRSPGEERTAFEMKWLASAPLETGTLSHRLTVFASRFRRVVSRGESVYDFVGSARLQDEEQPAFSPSPAVPGAPHQTRDTHDLAVGVSETLRIGEALRVDAGLRRSALRELRFSRADGAELPGFAKAILLPQAALSLFSGEEGMGYIAYSEGVELGATAGASAANAGEVLDPKRSRQWEAGGRWRPLAEFSLSAAVFRIQKGDEFLDAANRLVSRGRVRHDGVEASVEAGGRATRMTANAALLRARRLETGDASRDGKTPVNIPALRVRGRISHAVAALPGVLLEAAWLHESRKFVGLDNALSVPGFHRFDAGLRFERTLGGWECAWNVRVENIFNRFYWRDSGTAFGDAYLHPGAPRLLRFSLSGRF